MNRNFERGGSRKTGTRGLRKFWKVCAWGLSISMILGMGNIGSYIVTADDGEVQVTEIPAETSEPETETSEEPVFSVSPESTPSPEAAAYAVTEMTPAPSESTQPSESPAWTAAPEPSAISTVIPETAGPEPSAESTVLPETAEPVSSPVATEAPASMPEMSFEQKEETTGITVSVKAEAGTFPKGTTMELSPVEDQSILEDAKQASELQNPSAVAVDITFRDPDRNIIEPQKQIRVTMTSDVIRQAESVDVVHVPDQAEDTSTAVVDQVPDQNLSEEEKPAEDQVVFDADQFSVYAIVYTVDFTYNGFSFTMPGNGSILLSDLAEKLNLSACNESSPFDLSKVTGVYFSNPDLVTVSAQENGDYLLQSVKPFDTEETLTITAEGNTSYVIQVLDDQPADLSSFISEVDCYKRDSENNWVPSKEFADGDPIKIAIKYSIDRELSSNTLVYKLDNNIILPGENQKGDIKKPNTDEKLGTYEIKTDGTITLVFDPDKIDVHNSFSGDIVFEGTVHAENTSSPTKYTIAAKTEITVQPKTVPTDLSLTKTGKYDSTTGKILYTLVVSSEKGSAGPIQVSDKLEGVGISVESPSVITVKKGDQEKNILLSLLVIWMH